MNQYNKVEILIEVDVYKSCKCVSSRIFSFLFFSFPFFLPSPRLLFSLEPNKVVTLMSRLTSREKKNKE